MTVAARVNPGPGLRRATAHLADVRASATTDIRDDAARALLTASIDHARSDLEADPSKVEAAHAAGIDVTTAVRIRIAGPDDSAGPGTRRLHQTLVLRLREHGWITNPTQLGDTTTYRVERGDVLMFDRTAGSRR